MPRYDAAEFDPPAPAARVTLRNLSHPELVTSAMMLIDTGADVTIVPADAIEKIGLMTDSGVGYELAGFDGHEIVAFPVAAELTFAGRTFRGQYLVLDHPWGIIGRNLLNLLQITLDGPRLEWSVD